LNNFRSLKIKGLSLKLQEKELLEEIAGNHNLPEHIAIIMDGNGRWAKMRGMSRTTGHKEGINSVREIVEACGEAGIKYLTLFTFSTENWKRPKEEVSTLMKLLVHGLRKETDLLNEKNVCLKIIGNTDNFPVIVRNELEESIEKLKNNKGLTLILALGYSGRWDILQAVKKLIAESAEKPGIVEELSNEKFSNFLSTKDIPDPDLVIRTSGEYRISNFLLWQLAYSEIFVSDVCWPQFRKKQLYEAILDFQKRERRFGLVSEQIIKSKKTVKK
jgi:undecaprenyl diphosphate synthase